MEGPVTRHPTTTTARGLTGAGGGLTDEAQLVDAPKVFQCANARRNERIADCMDTSDLASAESCDGQWENVGDWSYQDGD